MKATMRTGRRRCAAALLLATMAPVLLAGARLPHLELERTLPAHGSSVETVPEIRLWFKEPPMQMGAKEVTLRIFGADGKVMASGNAARDPKDRKIYSVKLPRGLPPGAYTVAWQTMAQDGDEVRGEFSFSVTSH
jgi:methionine-rich copper-binding protein CopC